jgi:hypothetical protein
MHHLKRPLAAATVAAAAIGAAAALTGAATAATSCAPRQNVEVILDDSGSMALFDSQNLRVSGTKLLLGKASNQKKRFGAVQFGSDASTVFAPGVVAQNRAAMEAALDAQIKADDGATNYNAAFTKAREENGNADARIFLTDGGHNIGMYADGHKPGSRVDVIGFGSSTQGEDGARLAKIASETGGRYFAQTDANNLQSIMNEVDAAYNCQSAPTTFQDLFTAPNQTKSHTVNVGASTRSIEAVLTWVGAQNLFDVASVKIVRGGRTVAKSSVGQSRRKRRKATKLRITRTQGATFLALKMTRVKRGKLRIKLRASKLAGPTTLVTQIAKSTRK